MQAFSSSLTYPPPAAGAYNGVEYWEERVPMMQWWADHLDDLRKSGSVVSIAEACRSR
jgi:hypothetical protein